MEQKEDGVDLYENTDLVYSTRPGGEVPEKEEPDVSGSGSTKHNGGSSSGGSGYGSFHGSAGGSGSGSFSGSYGGSYSGKRQILMMYMTTTIRMILQKSGQRTLETEIMMTDMKMPMTTGKMNMMIKIFTLLPLWGFVRELREERA
ncbi:hypothetical protein DWY34_07275 [Blautia sp. AF25-12LB]|nr:hypothetical protein DWY34_07275 [Blautia sp. AF25-12LB]